MPTRAIQFLQKHKIPFKMVKYIHEEKGAEFAASAIGFPLNQTIKTLVVDIGKGDYCLALMPGDRQLALKRMATACSAKRAAMVDIPTAQRVTGYLVGGISPFGTKKVIPAVMEESLVRYDTVAINAGQRGTMLIMAPGDIVRALDCTVSQIAGK